MAAVIPLPLTLSLGEEPQMLFPALLLDGADAILVDCGYPGSLPALEDALRPLGLSLSALTGVVITHHDDDHMGALAELKRAAPQIRVFAGELEAPYISGARRSLRLIQAEALQPSLPPEAQAQGLQFCRRLSAVEPVPVDRPLRDRELLPWCGGCQVLATPGHTPGHLSLYLPACSALVSGDAAVVQDGALAVANPRFSLDLPAARRSLRHLEDLPWRTCLCFHGGILRRPAEAPSAGRGMILRSCLPSDIDALLRLFYDTVHTVCAADYSPAQLDAWAPADRDRAAWARNLLSRTALAAEKDGRLLGFGNIGPDGYLDLLYVHRDFQRQGAASALCDALETLYPVRRVTVHASITARPFFERRGYRVLRERRVERRGQTLTNYLMEKELTAWT